MKLHLPMKQHQQYESLTRNQRKNMKKRARRYQFEAIRKVYHKFTSKNIKKILIFMNIHCVNVNVVGNTLFLGLKNEQIRKEADQMLHSMVYSLKNIIIEFGRDSILIKINKKF